jgi:hypothetical protein
MKVIYNETIIDVEGAETAAERYTGITVTRYGVGEAVGLNRFSNSGTRGGTTYPGKDVLGSMRGITNDCGQLEEGTNTMSLSGSTRGI